jgi:hypothetical protein
VIYKPAERDWPQLAGTWRMFLAEYHEPHHHQLKTTNKSSNHHLPLFLYIGHYVAVAEKYVF